MHRLLALGLACVVLLAGCGGDSDGDGPTTSSSSTTAEPSGPPPGEIAAAYEQELDAWADKVAKAADEPKQLAKVAAQPPELEALETDDATYVATSRRADAVAKTAGDLAFFATSREGNKAHAKLRSRLWDLSSDEWTRSFKANTANYDRLAPVVYDERKVKNPDRFIHDTWKRYVREDIKQTEAYARKIAGTKASDPIGRSLKAFAAAELEEGNALRRQFSEELAAHPPHLMQMGYYTSQVEKLPSYVTPTSVSYTADKQLVRGFLRTIERLADDKPAAPGDAYRQRIVSNFVSPLKKTEYRSNRVTEQLWMLWRIQELEDTPDEAYADARMTVALQLLDGDPRNTYEHLLQIMSQADYGVTEKGMDPKFKAYMAWADERLSEPVAPLLRPTVAGFRAGLDKLPRKQSRKLFGTSNQQTRATNHIEREMRQAAKRLDDPEQLKAAVKQAVQGTQPAAAEAADAAPEA